MVLLLVLVYPSIRDLAELQIFIENLPDALRNLLLGTGAADFLSPMGYVNSRFFAFLAPGLLLAYAITTGSGAIAGEEENGTLELMLATPIARWQVVLEKVIALAVGISILAGVSFLGLWAAGRVVELTIPATNLAQASFSLALLGFFSGVMALAIGAASGKRGLGVGVATGFAVAGYLINALAPLVSPLKALQPITSFYYYGSSIPLRNGIDVSHVGVLLLATTLLVIVGALGLERRDLRA